VVSKRSTVANGDGVTIITGLPVPCTLAVVGPMCMGGNAINSGRFEFTADEPGDYTIWVSAPGWPDWSTLIAAAPVRSNQRSPRR
jgi:hypothetical protein